jgi:hypothetical protein
MAGRVVIPAAELERLAADLEGFPVKLGRKLIGHVTNPRVVNGDIVGTIVLTDGRTVDGPILRSTPEPTR